MKVRGPKLARPKLDGFRGTPRVTNKSDVARMKYILRVVDNEGANWTIGSRPNANSETEEFSDCTQVRKNPPPVRKWTFWNI